MHGVPLAKVDSAYEILLLNSLPGLTFFSFSYIINDFFAVNFEPLIFRLKGHHSKLCEIKVSVFDRMVMFRRIPIVMEVHRILDRATLIAKAQLSEVESIDDPKWKEDSYVEHVFLHLNIRVHSKPNEVTDEATEAKYGTCAPCGGVGIETTAAEDAPASVVPPEVTERDELIKNLSMKRKLTANEIIDLSMAIDHRITIFEKLFWKYLSKSNYMRIGPERCNKKTTKTYEQLVVGGQSPSEMRMRNFVDHKYIGIAFPDFYLTLTYFYSTILSILNRLMVEAFNDLAKNWIFIPAENYDQSD